MRSCACGRERCGAELCEREREPIEGCVRERSRRHGERKREVKRSEDMLGFCGYRISGLE